MAVMGLPLLPQPHFFIEMGGIRKKFMGSVYLAIDIVSLPYGLNHAGKAYGSWQCTV